MAPPRTKNAYVPPAKRASSSKGPPSKKASVESVQERRKVMAKRPVHPEKGLDMIALRLTFVPDIISAFGWVQVAQQVLPYNVALVREFYTVISPPEFDRTGRVRIQGRDVIFSPQRINEFYGVQDEPNVGNGLHAIPEISTNAGLASQLRINGSPSWGSNQEIKQSELHFPAAFWNLFSSHSLQPTKHTSDVTIKRGAVLYCLMTSTRFDLGIIIHREILEAATLITTRGILPFPGLITRFCSDAGVAMDARQTRPAARPIGCRSYNGIVKYRPGLRKIKANGEFKDADQPEPEGDSEEDDNEEEGQAEQGVLPDEEMFDIPPELQIPQPPAPGTAPGPDEAGTSMGEQTGPSSSATQPPPNPEFSQHLIQMNNTILALQASQNAAFQELKKQQEEFMTAMHSRINNLEQQIAERPSLQLLEQQFAQTMRDILAEHQEAARGGASGSGEQKSSKDN